MTDKERILSIIVTRVIPGLIYNSRFGIDQREYVDDGMIFNKIDFIAGDLVFTNTILPPNDFMVGYVHNVEEDYLVIREIGTKRLCKDGKDGFWRINKDNLGYQLLEGIQYKTYQKVLKAFENYNDYFKSINFDGDTCIVEGSPSFSNETSIKITFKYNNKTSIKSIVNLLEKEGEKEE